MAGEAQVLVVADVATALVMLATGAIAVRRSRAAGGLLAATGVLWVAGSWLPVAVFWHRATLLHLLLTFPRWRPRSWPIGVLVVAGYAVSVLAPRFWLGDDRGAVAVAVVALVACWTLRGSRGPTRHDRRVAAAATAVLAADLSVSAVVRRLLPAEGDIVVRLLAYDAVVAAVAVILTTGLRAPRTSELTDLVVDLGDGPAASLRDDLARMLHDPALRIGYWSAESGDYRDLDGHPLAPPEPGLGEAATPVPREDRPFAMIVHDAGLLADPRLLESLRTATRLTAVHAERQADVRQQIGAVAASRRRLLTAADDERRRLGAELSVGIQREIHDLLDDLSVVGATAPEREHLDQARRQLELGSADLDRLAAGLVPPELEAGLPAALRSLAATSPVGVEVHEIADQLPERVELLCYYVCAEAITNVAKHAPDATASVAVRRVGSAVWREGSAVRLTVVDDGPGGASPVPGGGLQGLRDRVESYGGRLMLQSDRNGTRLVAELPLDDQPR